MAEKYVVTWEYTDILLKDGIWHPRSEPFETEKKRRDFIDTNLQPKVKIGYIRNIQEVPVYTDLTDCQLLEEIKKTRELLAEMSQKLERIAAAYDKTVVNSFKWTWEVCTFMSGCDWSTRSREVEEEQTAFFVDMKRAEAELRVKSLNVVGWYDENKPEAKRYLPGEAKAECGRLLKLYADFK